MFNFAAPAPISARAEGVLRRSVEVAFDFVGAHFFENCRRWHPQVVEVEVLSGGNGEIGATARQITFDRGIRSKSRFELSEFEPPRRLALKGLTEPYRSSYDFVGETEASSRIVFTFDLLEIELTMRPFQKLIRAALQEGANQTLENIQQLLSTSEPAASVGAPAPPRVSAFEE